MRKVDYKRVIDKNRDKDLKSEFCRFCKYFNSNPCSSQKSNKEHDYCDSYKRFVEIYDRLADLEDKIKNGTLVELPCKGIEELDIIKKGMIFILYKMCLEQNLGQGVFLKYKSKINEWFKSYLKNKELQEKQE